MLRFIHFCFFIYRVTSLYLPCGRCTLDISFEAVTCSARPLRVAFFRVRRHPMFFALSPRCFYGMYKEIFVANSLSLLLTPHTTSMKSELAKKKKSVWVSKREKYLNTFSFHNSQTLVIFFNNRCVTIFLFTLCTYVLFIKNIVAIIILSTVFTNHAKYALTRKKAL